MYYVMEIGRRLFNRIWSDKAVITSQCVLGWTRHKDLNDSLQPKQIAKKEPLSSCTDSYYIAIFRIIYYIYLLC